MFGDIGRGRCWVWQFNMDCGTDRSPGQPRPLSERWEQGMLLSIKHQCTPTFQTFD